MGFLDEKIVFVIVGILGVIFVIFFGIIVSIYEWGIVFV